MSGLKSFTPATDVVKFTGGEAAVRGLSLEDLTILIREHKAPMTVLFERYVVESEMIAASSALGLGNALSELESVVIEAVEMAPALIGDIIARSMDEHDQPQLARLLPIGVQIEAIGKIVRLTLEAEGGMEKLMGTINLLLASLSTAKKNRSQ